MNRGDQVGESRSTTRWMTSPAFSDHWNARSASSWIRASCRFSASRVDSTRPTGGPHCGSAMRRTIIRSITCCTSSSRSSSTSTRSTVAASAATRCACEASDSHLPSRLGTCASRSLVSHDLRRQEVLPDEGPEPLAQLVLLALDDRGVRNRYPQRMLEQRGHREPVRQGAHHAGLRGSTDIPHPRSDPGEGGCLSLRPPAGQKDAAGADQKAQRHHLHPTQRHPPLGIGLGIGTGKRFRERRAHRSRRRRRARPRRRRTRRSASQRDPVCHYTIMYCPGPVLR